MFLKELSDFQSEGLPAYFKGGTALYKALKMTNRFSEDIDLSVDTRGCSRTQGDKRLEKASKDMHPCREIRSLDSATALRLWRFMNTNR